MVLEELLPLLIIVCPLAFLGALVDSVAGGGGIISLSAYLIAGLPGPMALGTNKCGSTFGMVLAAGRFIKKKEFHPRSAIVAAVTALVGAALGSQLAQRMSDRFVYYLILALIPVLAWIILFKPDMGAEDRSGRYSPGTLTAISAGIGLVLGGYDGFFGPGSGTFLMLAFATLGGFDLLTASGNTKIVNGVSCVTALISYAMAGQVNWWIGIPAAICGVAGHYVGSGLALKNGAKVIRPMFLLVLALLVIKLLWDLLA